LYISTVSAPALDSFWFTLNDSFDVVVGLFFCSVLRQLKSFQGAVGCRPVTWFCLKVVPNSSCTSFGKIALLFRRDQQANNNAFRPNTPPPLEKTDICTFKTSSAR
jgi:hypothetical protein